MKGRQPEGDEVEGSSLVWGEREVSVGEMCEGGWWWTYGWGNPGDPMVMAG